MRGGSRVGREGLSPPVRWITVETKERGEKEEKEGWRKKKTIRPFQSKVISASETLSLSCLYFFYQRPSISKKQYDYIPHGVQC